MTEPLLSAVDQMELLAIAERRWEVLKIRDLCLKLIGEAQASDFERAIRVCQRIAERGG